jgi:hypothetical protein
LAKNQTSFTEGNQAATVHGGAAAVRSIATKTPFTGLAGEVEKKIQSDYELEGPAAMLLKDCVRIHTAADMYWQAIMGAAESGDVTKFESYVKTYGWLATAGARLLGQLAATQGKEAPTKALDVIRSLKGVNNDPANE